MMRTRSIRDFSRLLDLGFLLAATLTLAFAPAAASVETRAYGGSGGRYFEQRCNPGRVLVGIVGSVGVYIDGIKAVCGRVDAAGTITDIQAEGRLVGTVQSGVPMPGGNGVGGWPGSWQCPSQEVVVLARVATSSNIPRAGAIDLICQEIGNRREGGEATISIRPTGLLESRVESQDSPDFDFAQCPPDMLAVGFLGRTSDVIEAFGLICDQTPVPAPVTVASDNSPFAQLVGQEASFQASNYLDRFIRHRNSLGYAEAVSGDLGRDDSTFRIQPGLAGRCISLESHNYPGQFLRHQAWRVKLAPNDNSDLFKQDATFCMVPGLASSAGVSFESVNNPHHFIRHRNGELWVDDFDGSDLFRADATFNVTNPGGSLMVR